MFFALNTCRVTQFESMKIALACNLPLEDVNFEFDHDIWPGSGFIKSLNRMVKAKGGELRLAQDWKDEEGIYLIQEELCQKGKHLTKALKAVNYCLESKIYAHEWYASKPTDFKKILSLTHKDTKCYFPSYEEKDIKKTNPIPFSERKPICAIMSNKHYAALGFARHTITQLHDYRYEAVRWLQDRYGLELYGRGWGFDREVRDKLSHLQKYKACLVIENDQSDGYATEKAVHCAISGTIPVYLGSTDYPGCFTMPGGKPDIESTMEYISGMTEEQHRNYIQLLQGSISHNYSYDAFAKQILDCIA